MFMLKWAFYSISWVCCVGALGMITSRPEELAVQLRGLGMPATAADIVFSDRSVLWVCGLCVACLFGYAIPRIVSRLHQLMQLRRAATDIASARHEHRSVAQLEELVQQHAMLLSPLAPVSAWAYDSSNDTGEPLVMAKHQPSSMLSIQQLKKGPGWLTALSFMPQLLVLAAAVIILVALSRSADKAFAEVLSVANTDYGTMILGLRSAAAAMAIALLSALLIWLADKLLDYKMLQYAEAISTGLNQLIGQEDVSAIDLVMPTSERMGGAQNPRYEAFLEALNRKMVDMNANIQALSKAGANQPAQMPDLTGVQAAMDSSAQKQDMLLGTLQQSMDELQALRKDVTALHTTAAQPLPVPSNDLAASKLTTAIRALKDSAAIDLPQL
jgi:hypothetical protein